VFDDNNADWTRERAQLAALLDDDAYAEARRTTINAHYTDPAVARELWAALDRLGFEGGTVLEPGSGSGTFIGVAPENATVVGVELDSTTASISRGLYPHATIRTESFAASRFQRDQFDATIGNVPFADVALHDPVHNAGGHTMHNHFILKSLALTRPGGMVAVLTSSFTMDGTNPAARREMNGMADLVGAVRLPSGAFRRSAGTEALTDVLIFRRRQAGAPAHDHLWETVLPRIVDGEKIRVNAYFDANPEQILGDIHVGTGMFGGQTVSVRGRLDDVAGDLGQALTRITDRAIERGAVFAPRSLESQAAIDTTVLAGDDEWAGTIVPGAADTFTVIADGAHAALPVPKTHARELRDLLTLRDAARGLLEAEAATLDDTAQLDTQRAELRGLYGAYTSRYGALNRYNLRATGKADPETNEPRMARVTPTALRILRQDPFGSLVMALERFDDETQTGIPAALMNQRVVAPRPTAQGADTPSEAISISLDRTGGVDIDLVAHLLGQDVDEARTSLGDLVYADPASGALVHAPEYLSGDVRSKLAAATLAADEDPTLQINVDALRAVMPADIGVDEIEARLGAVWIDEGAHQQFLRETLNDRSVRVENTLPGEWDVKNGRHGLKATNEWGTDRRPAGVIAQSLMEQKAITVYDEIDDGDRVRRVLNPVETAAAQEKADALQERFSEWVWEDPERANKLAAEYNRRFNSIVLRDYSKAGEYLTFPGMAANFSPRPHQRAAVARMIAEPSTGLFHQVGAGKTAEMFMGATELKRMGLVNKPVIVVPNHMLDQFAREWLQVYPQARILAASSDDLAGDKRRLFVARAAANDWDGIVMTRTAFQRVGLSTETEADYVDREISMLRNVLDSAQAEERLSVKRIEKRVLQLEEKYKAMIDKPKDPGITFEQTGIDYLIVDELHDYKNLATTSNIRDAAIDGSQKATDLHMKAEFLRNRNGAHVMTGATATPLSNSVTEAYVMQRYLRPDLLEAAGVSSFDGWAATFGQTVTEMEMAPAGGFRLKTRFAKFQNVPEMLRMWHVFADVKTAEDLKLPVPLIAARASDGMRLPETIVMAPGPELEAYIAQIGKRAEDVQNKTVTPDVDNMLKISTDGRKAALDMRLVGGGDPEGPVKLDAVAAQVHRQWEMSRDTTYLDDITREESPVRGGLQLVFCDLGTPNETRWDAYNELKDKLTKLGVPRDSVRFMHEAKNDTEKARMFAAARAGHIAVLIGSTAKMGVGTNVQARLTAMHHVECPWRPSDLEQRDGRGIRQGNQNAEVGIFRYVVERSFDGYSWQTVERKARFINQIMKGKLDSREIEDIGDTAMSAAEAKALSSGNPLILEKANADADLQKLQRLERAYHRSQSALATARAAARRHIETATPQLAEVQAAATRSQDISGDAFRVTIGDRTYDQRAEAGLAIADWSDTKGMRHFATYQTGRVGVLGNVAGHDVEVSTVATQWMGSGRLDVQLTLRGVPESGSTMPLDEFCAGGVGLVTRLENKVAALPRTATRIAAALEESERTVVEADTRLGEGFKHAPALAAAQGRVADVDRQLKALLEETTRAEREVPPASAPEAPRPTQEERASRIAALAPREQAAAPDAPWRPTNGGPQH